MSATSRVLPQDRLLETSQLFARLEPELVEQHATRVLVGGERICLPPRAVEGEHQLSPKALAKRIPRDEPFQLAEEIAGSTEREIGVEPLLERLEPRLLEARDLGLRERLEGQILERRSAPK